MSWLPCLRSDRRVLSCPEMRAGFLSMLREALRQGGRGPQHDTRLMVSPWDFHPEEDAAVHVELWHGEDDRNAPPAMARYVAGAICRTANSSSSRRGAYLPDRRADRVRQSLALYDWNKLSIFSVLLASLR